MQFQKNNTLDTKALGLEVSLAIAKFVTGKENMHYGVWDNLDPCLENLGKAQEQYTKLLLKYFPKKKKQTFDLCLFSESFQYIPAKIALKKAKELLNKGGQILVADCFRSDVKHSSHNRRPGGGHPLSEMLKLLPDIDLNII